MPAFSTAKCQNLRATVNKLLKNLSISLALIAFITVLPSGSFAQYTITGRVLNQVDTKPVADASVFLSNTATGNKTAGNGTFTLKDARPGKYKLVISIVGFETYNETLIVGNGNINLHDITIFPKTIGLKEVTIRVNRNRDKYFNMFYDRFKREFLGRSDAADECKILNPQVLDFDYDAEINTLTVSSQGFLEIENDALGYKINYLLTNFRLNDYTNEIHYEGPVLFTEMTGTPGQERRWQQRRRTAYEGSMMHFLRSAMNDRLEEEGFRAYQLAVYANPDRPVDSVIEAKIKKFSNPYYNSPKYKHLPGSLIPLPDTTTVFVDSLKFYQKKAKQPKILQALMHFPLNKGDIISSTHEPGIFAFGCDSDKLLIMYDKNHRFAKIKQLTDLNNLNYILNKYYNKELTLVNFTTPYAFFDVNGWVADPNSLAISGVWSQDRVAELLRVNYEAPQNAIVLADNVVKNIENKIDTFTANHPTEKVYLHLDKPWYGPGDTVWFKAYTVAGTDHRTSDLSGVLYAELISAKDTVLQRLTIQLNQGTGMGEFVLPYTYKSGTFRIRAYTNWMRNDSSAYFYDHDIMIGQTNPQPDQSSAANAQPILSANNNLQQNRAENPDVQFFPEGGYLVNGLRSKIAFKAVNKNGLAANVQGVIIDEDNNELASFNTQHAGMGQFPLTPQPGKQYKAKITCTDGSSYLLNLPKAQDAGFTLSVNNTTDSLYLTVAASDALYKSKLDTAFYVIAESDGKYYFAAGGKLINHVFTTNIAKTRFPSGIARFTLFSQNGEPFNERMVFIKNKDLLNLGVTTEKESYAPKEKVKIDLAAKNEEANAVSGTFSVAVTEETKVPVDEASEHTIFTDLLLTPALKGDIENPNYYFINNDDKTHNDLDLLLLTQYNDNTYWDKILSPNIQKIIYKPEKDLSLEGFIKTSDGLPLAGVKVSVACLTENLAADTLTDKSGHFIFDKLNATDSVKFFIKAQKEGEKRKLNIYIRQSLYPEVNELVNTYFPADTVRQGLTNRQKTANSSSKSAIVPKKAIALKEVKIKSTKTEKPNMMNKYGADDPYTIPGTRLQDFGLIRMALASILPNIVYSYGAFRKLEVPGATLHVVLNNHEINADAIDNYVGADEVENVKLLEGDAYKALYGVNRNPGQNGEDDIVLITTKQYAGTDKTGHVKLKSITLKLPDDQGILEEQQFLTTSEPSNIMVYPFSGYHNAHEFNSRNNDNQKQADDRKTIYWNPNIITDKDGKATFGYFNAGSPGTYRVVIEGVDADGNLGRQVFRYKVE